MAQLEQLRAPARGGGRGGAADVRVSEVARGLRITVGLIENVPPAVPAHRIAAS